MAVRLSLAAAFIIAVITLSGWEAGPAQAQQPAAPAMNNCPMCQQMMADMTAAGAKLDGLVKEMNAAKGEAKIDALAVVVTELVAQQKTMHRQVGEMHQHMMGMGGPMMHR